MHPVLYQFQIGQFQLAIYSYGAMLALAFLLGIWVAGRRAPSRGMNPQLIVDLSLWVLVLSIIGARVLYVSTNWEYYRFHLWEILMVQKGGLVFYGGLIIGILTVVAFTRLKQMSFWQVADVMTPSIALGQAIGRIGCFLNGCCYGKLTSVAWGVQFPEQSPASQQFGPLHVVHPTQLYSTGANLLLFFFLLWIDPRRKFDGQTFWIYVLCYGIARFGLEFFRGDNQPIFGFLTLSQTISIFLFILAVAMLAFLAKRTRGHAGPV